jgi:hypothetical protein
MPHVVKVYDEVNAKTAHILSGVTYTFDAMVEGSAYTGNLQTVPILNSTKKDIGWFDSSACTFTGDVFVTEKEEELNVLSNGDYYLDYKNGYYKVIAATSATPTISYTTYMIAIASVVDVELGSVELKNGTDDTRATINAANTARTTGTTTLVVQNIDATGKVSPAGDAVGNAPFVKLGDGTDTLNILVDNAAFSTGSTGIGIFGKYEATATTYNDGDAVPIKLDENGRVVLSSDIEIGGVELKNGTDDTRATINAANTARSTGTTTLAVQTIDAAGKVMSSNGFRIIAESSLTVTTAGTPVACPTNASAKAVRVINNNVDGTIIAVGLSATVDAISSPPIGVVLTSYSSVVMYVVENSNEIAIDSSTSLKTATIQILGI